ncbi:MAG: molecular chaperone DnaK [Elusimicrobia bacterium RIFOXYA1_FULL_47_7]|nr:MAG: molecular chaperone DnaK [Elusimicrobia bacterium RIFOXYA12_FULL_49_49]OGS10004.1 MAG: molecular chaperone DnaK [Elusimicrobia bacterium RIFOXYA1_FULL_47_7]OGS11762.1 MAG: molecular chaperone DnaK [Elusimicrobia bacterium RIFOXYB1_FULL_48_9]OGS15597.1 MAG: molecular chaperone DnaK [Elusimicrobia bacterium RIFOXYA2_FULL_47_53]OGS26847.1 MAG: molecular chaperone DnaK [Elusimicrobia bacterium RIFOXYB12_FULL_50_12]OGS30696.1 MAG: molecular chaperone DnaK [Elusimicrobia bacterium RIFOXYB2_F
MAKIIGIDLGTSNSAAAVLEGGKSTIIPSAEGTTLGGKAFPSYVAFTKDGQLIIGEPARRQAITNTEGTLTAFKRKMGTDFKYNVYGKEYTPQQLSAFILQKVKRDAEAFLGEPVTKAVITVPAYFNDNQRQATKDAGSIAGLEVVRLVNEPTAAALAFGIDKAGKEQKILVFDLGGGTLDVTIMEMGAEGTFEVLSTSGDTQLGGTDMDNALIDHIAEIFRSESGIDLRKDKMAFQRLKEAAEKAKIELSNVLETDLNLPFITADASGPKHLTMKLSRATLDNVVRPIVERCKASVDQAMSDAKLTAETISKIILVGGPTRMPIVQKFVEDHVGKKVERGIDPMECVAIGAGIQAAVLTGEVKDILLLDVTPLTLGVETMGGVRTAIIERNTTIPVKRSQVFSTAADNQPSVEIHVLQGERPMAKDNVSLGKFFLDGIPPAPRGVPQVEVTYDIDANGILHVTAKDLGTGKEQSIRITAPNKLNKEDVEKFVKEAEKFSEDDKKRKEEIEAKNEADTLVYATEKSLKEHGDKISADERLNVERCLNETKEALKSGDINTIKKSKDALTEASHKLAEAVYREAQKKSSGAQQGAEQGAPEQNGQPQSGPQDNVVDAEVVKDDKNK